MKISPILLVLFLSGNATAAMYKWVDDEGNTHYTQSPPPESAVTSETMQPPPDVNTNSANQKLEQQQELVEKMREQRLEGEEKKALSQEELARKQSNCELAKRRAASFVQPRVRYTAEDGSRAYYTEEERQEQIKTAEDMIKEFCN